MALYKPGQIRMTESFGRWVRDLPKKGAAQVLARIERIDSNGHLGDCKRLNDVLFELRWKNGTRVYFTFLSENGDTILIMILGGTKNGQKQDIIQADRTARRYLADSR